MKIDFEWEVINNTEYHTENRQTSRAKVFGGWLVSEIIENPTKTVSSHMVFIPDANYEWEV